MVLTDLSKVEPAVREAEQGTLKAKPWDHLLMGCDSILSYVCIFCIVAVQAIKKQHLVEVKNFPNPPKLVKLAMESICMLIGEPTTDWKAIRGIVMRDNFITSVVNFKTDEMR